MKKITIFWRLYLCILIILHILVLADETLPELKNDPVPTISIIAFSMVGIVGVIFYVFNIRTLNKSLWSGILMVTILWDLYQNLYLEAYIKKVPLTWEYIPAYIFLILPLYIAIYRYRSLV